MLADAKTVQEAEKISTDGQDVMNRIEKNQKPVVAAIMGSCLGGGLEVGDVPHNSSDQKLLL